jgi:hypothetical protein
MKRVTIFALALVMVAALSIPAAAFDSEFGGYWRTRAFSQSDFSGDDNGGKDLTQVDTRSRLYYTAYFSDDFKFVNKFEWNSTWGDTVGGDIGSDGTGILRIKHSYANFNLGSFNFLVGMQPRVLGRGFLFDDDFAGAVATYKGEGFDFPFIWMKAYEGGMGKDKNDNDVDYYGVKPTFNVGDMKLVPFALAVMSSDASAWGKTTANEDVSVYFIGLDLDAKLGAGSVWLTGIFEAGDVDLVNGTSIDVTASLFALGGSIGMGPADLRAQFIYASGDSDLADTDAEAFFVPAGQSYYWAEIMGMGIFDNQSSAGSCANAISNLMAANLGVGFSAMDKVKVDLDLWFANLVEENAAGDDALGTEIDLKLTYPLIENMKMELVAAYLSAGDATSPVGADNDGDPLEFGTRISFSF